MMTRSDTEASRRPPPTGRGRTSIGLWFAILAVALIARLAFIAVVAPDQQLADSRDYDEMARQLVDHGTYGLQTLRAPGYPTFIAGVYLVFGKSLFALRFVECLIGTLCVALEGLIGTRLFGRAAGLIAATLAALHPVLAFLPSTEYTENVMVLVILLSLAAAFEGLRRGGLWRWACSGALLGIAILIRPNIISLAPGLALGFTCALLRARRAWMLPMLITAFAMILAVAPWVVRCHQVQGRWYFIATGGGRQFYGGNNPWTDGSTRVHPTPDAATTMKVNRQPDEFARDRLYYKMGMEFIREHPARAAQLYLIHMKNLFALYPDTVMRTFINRWSQGTQGLASVVIFAGALLALRRWRSESALWPMTAAIVTFALANSLIFASLRYRMAFEPYLLLMAGLGWASLVGWSPAPVPASRASAAPAPATRAVTS